MVGASRSALAAAARRLLDERLGPVEVLGVALREYEVAQAAYERAAELVEEKAVACRAAHTSARAQGWAPAELRQLGLEPPPAPRRRREGSAPDAGGSGDGGDGGEPGSSEVREVAERVPTSTTLDHPAATETGTGTTSPVQGEELRR